VAVVSGDALDRRLEEAGLNVLHSRRQLLYDGWLLFLLPGRAKRARSVNAHFGSTLPVADKIARCERVYAGHGLPALFRITPFSQPASLDAALAQRGYLAFDETLVQAVPIETPPGPSGATGVALETVTVDAFVEAIGAIRGSPPTQRGAHLERLAHSPIASRAVVARANGAVVGCGMVAIDEGVCGLFDIATVPVMQRAGVATAIVARLLALGWERGAKHAFLQVTAGNAPALALYRKFGFRTRYRYHYRAREQEVE
jgi:ribosomal protein S18 acetylase RimI-like enzyme